jgi:hypothetical protein
MCGSDLRDYISRALRSKKYNPRIAFLNKPKKHHATLDQIMGRSQALKTCTVKSNSKEHTKQGKTIGQYDAPAILEAVRHEDVCKRG